MASCSQHMSSEFVLLEQFLILGTLILSLWHRSLKSCNVWSILSMASTLPCNDCSWMRILALAFKRDLRTTEGAKLSRPAKKNKDIVVVVVTKGLSHLLCLHATLNLTFYLNEKALAKTKLRATRNKKMHDEVFVQKNWVVHMNSVVNKITDNVTLQKYVKCDICYM